MADLPTPAEIDAINNAYAAVEDCYSQGLNNAIACGMLLKTAKAKVGHGNWAQWLKDKCPKIKERTAADYMWMAKKEEAGEVKKVADQISTTHADLSELSIAKVKELLPKKQQTEKQKAATAKLVADNKAAAEKDRAAAAAKPASPDLTSMLKNAGVDKTFDALTKAFPNDLDLLGAYINEFVQKNKPAQTSEQPRLNS